MRPFVVEVFGVAGAGKTTLVEALTRHDREFRAGILLSRAQTLPLYVLHTAVFLPTYLRGYRHSRWFTVAELRAMGYLRAWHRFLVRRSGTEGVVLLDHGPLFRLATLTEFGPPLTASPSFRRWWGRALSRWATALDLIVWLDAPDHLLVPRIRSRGQRHVVKHATEKEAVQFITRYRAAYEAVVQRLLDASPVPLLRFDTGGSPPERIAEEVARVITLERSRRSRTAARTATCVAGRP